MIVPAGLDVLTLTSHYEMVEYTDPVLFVTGRISPPKYEIEKKNNTQLAV